MRMPPPAIGTASEGIHGLYQYPWHEPSCLPSGSSASHVGGSYVATGMLSRRYTKSFVIRHIHQQIQEAGKKTSKRPCEKSRSFKVSPRCDWTGHRRALRVRAAAFPLASPGRDGLVTILTSASMSSRNLS